MPGAVANIETFPSCEETIQAHSSKRHLIPSDNVLHASPMSEGSVELVPPPCTETCLSMIGIKLDTSLHAIPEFRDVSHRMHLFCDWIFLSPVRSHTSIMPYNLTSER